MRVLLVAGVLAGAVGCGGDLELEFPDGLAPLEDCLATLPEGDDYPQDLVTVGGQDGYAWAHAAFYVHGDPAEVYEALIQPEVVVDYSRVDSFTSEIVADPEFDDELILFNVSQDIIDIEFELTWKFGVVAEDGDGVPQGVAARFSKTGGTDIIELMEGSVVVTSVDDGVSSVEVVEWLDNPIPDPEDILNYFAVFHDQLTASVAGEPLPWPQDEG